VPNSRAALVVPSPDLGVGVGWMLTSGARERESKGIWTLALAVIGIMDVGGKPGRGQGRVVIGPVPPDERHCLFFFFLMLVCFVCWGGVS